MNHNCLLFSDVGLCQNYTYEKISIFNNFSYCRFRDEFRGRSQKTDENTTPIATGQETSESEPVTSESGNPSYD